MSEEQTQDNNPEVNHVKDMIDSLSQGDNILKNTNTWKKLMKWIIT